MSRLANSALTRFKLGFGYSLMVCAEKLSIYEILIKIPINVLGNVVFCP